MRTSFISTLAALPLGFLAGCTSYVPVAGGDNFAYLYGKGAAAIRLDARIHQPDPEHAVIYYKLRTTDLLYKGTGGGGPYHARVEMGYEAYAADDTKRLLDSASTFIKDQSGEPNEDKVLIGSMPLTLVGNDPFLLRITAHDLNRDAQSAVLLRVDRGTAGTALAFLPMGTDNLPIFNDHVPAGTPLKIRADSHAGQLLQVAHFPPITQLPAPVFSDADPPSLNMPPDSTFTIKVGNDGTFPFTMGSSGFYHFRADSTGMAGFTLFVTTANYPSINTAQGMAAPLRYITSTKEWETLSSVQNPRKQVERFWTDAAGSRDRAREAIAAYYGRVESANRHFSSYTEGWKTDRGLVHIIFGMPTSIRMGTQGETWTYGDASNLMSLEFRFVRRQEPFSDNDLVLQRDPQLKSAWYRNVESWRNGRILQY